MKNCPATTQIRWASERIKLRRFQDYAAAVLVAGGNGIGLGAVIKIYPDAWQKIQPSFD